MPSSMMMTLALVGGGFAALLSFASPRWGSYLFWFITLMYPSSLLYNLLPLSIRFDDLFLVYLTLICIRIAPPDVLTSRSFRMALLWFIAIAIGNMIGLLTGPGYLRDAVIKVIGKSLYVPMIVYVMNTVVRDEAELRRMIRVIMLASLGSMAIGVVQVYRPELTAMWETPSDSLLVGTASETWDNVEETTRRAGGSLGTTALALTASVMSLLFLRLMAQVPTLIGKLWYAMSTVLAMAALGFTITRGAILGFALSVIYGIVSMPRRAGTVAIVVIGLFFAATRTDLAERLSSRLTGGSGSARVVEGAEGRLGLWMLYIENFSVHYFFFGRGFNAEFVRTGGSAHSSLIGAFAYTGMFGFIVLVWLIASSWGMARRLARDDPDPYYRAVGEGLTLGIVCMIVNGVTNELWQLPQIIFFSLTALADIRLRESAAGMHMGQGAPYAWLGAPTQPRRA